MLSEKEKRWVFIGGGGVVCLLYVFLVLYPLYNFQQKTQKRIQRSWQTAKQLEKGLRRYKAISDTTRLLIRRAAASDGGIPTEKQLRGLVNRIAGKAEIRREPGWEGQGVTLAVYFLKTRVSSVQIFELIQRIDHHYLPMRVVTWAYRAAENGLGVLNMKVVCLEKGNSS